MEHNKDSTTVSPVADATETSRNFSLATPTETTANNINTSTTHPAGESAPEITTEASPPSYEQYASKRDIDDIC
jgi:hypothetical protein